MVGLLSDKQSRKYGHTNIEIFVNEIDESGRYTGKIYEIHKFALMVQNHQLEYETEPKDTINTFIKDLKRISPDKRKLPLVINTKNGLQEYPTIKMQFKSKTGYELASPFLGDPLEKMVITVN